MGYVPNMAARAMKTNRTYNLGVLFVDERQSGLAHEYFSAVLDSFKDEIFGPKMLEGVVIGTVVKKKKEEEDAAEAEEAR